MSTSRLDDKGLFNVARKIDDPVARQQYLEQVCDGDLNLLHRVELLLRGYEKESRFLETPAIDFKRTFIAPQTVEAPGTQLGPYKIRELLGEGGMGVVYVAEQTEPVRRKVALKIIKPGMDSKEVIARFDAERQALAMMNHPNIAKVLDGGTTENGRPYFVMELVKGTTITSFCDEQKLTVRERLEVFITVCQAVQHAHLKGIIHRDLKPNNVLVELHDVNAVPKVIDFGIAKATNQQLTQQTVYTQFSQLVGTPLYMSPEQSQLSGLDIDTRSDVYSLGVMLYELLVGALPFDDSTLERVGLDEMRRMIREDDPPRPSSKISTLEQDQLTVISKQRRIDPRQLSNSMRRELDWIVMKAMEKDRTRRYESASDMAQDLQRYLEDQPVEACPPSVGYKMKKYVKRHKGLLTALTMMAATLVIATGVSLSYAYQATKSAEDADTAREDADAQKTLALSAEALAKQHLKLEQQSRREANRERDRANLFYVKAREAVDQMLSRVADNQLSKAPQLAAVRKNLLQDAVQFYTGLLSLDSDDSHTYAARSKVYELLKEFRSQRTDLEKAVKLSPNTATHHEQLANFLKGCVDVRYRDYEQALLHAKMACELEPQVAVHHYTLAAIYHQELNNKTAAIKEYQTASELSKSSKPHFSKYCVVMAAVVAGDKSKIIELSDQYELDSPWAQFALNNAAKAHFSLGEFEKSVAANTRAIEAAQQTRADSSNFYAFYLYRDRADAYFQLGEFETALADYNKTLELAPFRSYAYKRRARAHFELKQFQKCLADLEKSWELNRDDESVISWIPPEDIAACPDAEFQDSMRAFVERVTAESAK